MRLVVLFSFLLQSCLLHSQDYIDLFSAQYQNTNDNRYKNESYSTKVQELAVNITLPVKVSEKVALISGFSYDNTKLNYKEAQGKIDLQGYTFRTGVNIKHNEKLSGTYVVIPKWAIGIKEKGKSNFQLGGAAIWKYKKSEHFKYVLGLYYNEEFFGPFTTPLFGFYYKKGKLEADVMLPAITDVNYAIAKKSTLGFHFRSIAKSYNLATGLINNTNEYIVQSSNEPSLYIGKKLFKNIILKAHIGHSIGRSYRIYNSDEKMKLGLSAFRIGDKRTKLNNDFNNGFFFKLNMAYRFYLND